jgi:hypothetical protein
MTYLKRFRSGTGRTRCRRGRGWRAGSRCFRSGSQFRRFSTKVGILDFRVRLSGTRRRHVGGRFGRSACVSRHLIADQGCFGDQARRFAAAAAPPVELA